MTTKRMKLKLLFSAAALLFIHPPAGGENIRIKGTGPGYRGQELRIFIQSDPVTLHRKPLLRVKADENDYFEFQIPLNDPAIVYIKSGIYSFSLFTEKGKNYDVQLPPFVPKPGLEDQNPFFRETELIPEILNDEQDLNNLIRSFDNEYNPIFNQVAGRVFINYKRTEIPLLIENLKKFHVPDDNPFFSDYVRCRMAMLNLISMGSTTNRISEAGFINERFIPENPAYTDLVSQLFTGYLARLLAGTDRDRIISAITSASYKDLRGAIVDDKQISNNQLIDYVILSGLYNMYFVADLPDSSIVSVIISMKKEAPSDYIRNLAAVVLDRILPSMPGHLPPVFSLKDQNGENRSIKDFAGSYVLLNFTTAGNRMTIAEFEIIKAWGGRFDKKLTVVTILAGESFASGLEKMRTNGYNWIFLDGSQSDNIEFDFAIKMYPSFILLDREGRIVSNPCPFPSENVEEIITRLLFKENATVISGSMN
jgi:hypothetical protein